MHFNITFYSHHNEIQPHIVSSLRQMLDEHNTHAKSFRMARDRLADNEVHNVKLKLVANREKDGRTYNVPTVLEVAALIAVILIRIQEEILFLRLEMANYKRYMNCILVI